MNDLKISAHICAQGRSYEVTFTDEDQAIAWMRERSSTHAFHEIEEKPLPDTAAKLLDFLYPTCDHGLSASLCAGPGHYPPDREGY